MLMCFLMTYMAIIIYEILRSLVGCFRGGVYVLKILRSKQGEGYIDVAVLVLCAMLVIALAVRVFPAYITNNR